MTQVLNSLEKENSTDPKVTPNLDSLKAGLKSKTLMPHLKEKKSQ